jgi:hypothetical protein
MARAALAAHSSEGARDIARACAARARRYTLTCDARACITAGQVLKQ